MNTREKRTKMMVAKGYMLLADAAKCAGVSEQTIRNWITEGMDGTVKVKAVKVTNTFYINRDSLRAHLGEFMYPSFDAAWTALSTGKRKAS